MIPRYHGIYGILPSTNLALYMSLSAILSLISHLTIVWVDLTFFALCTLDLSF